MSQSCVIETEAGESIPGVIYRRRLRSIIYELADGTLAKVLRPLKHDATAHDQLMRQEQLAHLDATLAFLAKTKHPGLLYVHGRVRDQDGNPGFVCERLDERGPLGNRSHVAVQSIGNFILVGARLARAAFALHECGWIHRDITPANVCFRQGVQPVLIDFELSARQQGGRTLDSVRQMRGFTPSCCSPEHVSRLPLTTVTDVHGVGLTLLSWITNQEGYATTGADQTVEELIEIAREGKFPHWGIVMHRLQGHDKLLGILAKTIQVDPYARYQCAGELARDLEILLETTGNAQLGQPFISMESGGQNGSHGVSGMFPVESARATVVF